MQAEVSFVLRQFIDGRLDAALLDRSKKLLQYFEHVQPDPSAFFLRGQAGLGRLGEAGPVWKTQGETPSHADSHCQSHSRSEFRAEFDFGVSPFDGWQTLAQPGRKPEARTAQPGSFWTNNATSVDLTGDADASEQLRRLGWGQPKLPQPKGQGWWTVQPQNSAELRADWGKWDASQLPRGLDLKKTSLSASFGSRGGSGGGTPRSRVPEPGLWLSAQPLSSVTKAHTMPAVQQRWIDEQPLQSELTQKAMSNDSDIQE